MLVIDNVTWDYLPEMKLAGGASKVRVRRAWDGKLYAVVTPGSDPLSIEGQSSDVVINSVNARQLFDLYRSGKEFPASFPGVMPDGGDLSATRCVITDFPAAEHVKDPLGVANLSSFSFKIVILE